ncbi:MAG TPA: hypothetical protein PK264_10330 [Hyphomicrobiaceae bacterium]|nr:hypothetical protein [Hyphomicrobiaceae bacterium]
MRAKLRRMLWKYWTYRWQVSVDGEVYDVRHEVGWTSNVLTVSRGGAQLASEALNYHREPFRLQEVAVDTPGGPLTFQTAPRTWLSYGLRVLRGETIVHQSHADPFALLPTMLKVTGFGTSEVGKAQVAASKQYYPAMAVDFAMGVILYFAAGFMSLRDVAILGAALIFAVQFAEWILDRLLGRKTNLTGGLSVLGVFFLLLSAGFAWLVDNDLAIQLKSSILGLISAAVLAVDAIYDGRYIGVRIARFFTFIEIDPRRFSGLSALVAAGQSTLSAAIALFLSKNAWLFYRHWIGPALGLALGL